MKSGQNKNKNKNIRQKPTETDSRKLKEPLEKSLIEQTEKGAAELIIANKELAYQNKEKEERAAELLIANKELAFQNKEKKKRAAELIIANKELNHQNVEKEKRADELVIADKELAFQSKEKKKRADELIIANKELTFQNKEKEKRADELSIAIEAYRSTNEYLESLINCANAPIIVWNTKLKITRFNKAFESLTGRVEKDVIGKSLEILFPLKFRSRYMDRIKETLKGKRMDVVEILILNIDGSLHTLLWSSANIMSPDGKTPIATIAQGHDITIRKSLKKSKEYLENLFRNANAPIIVWDNQFNISRFNPAFEVLTGRKAVDAIGNSIEILFPANFVESYMELIRKAQAGERWETVEIKILHLNGSIRTLLWNSASVFDTDGKTMIATIAQGQDITERKLVEEKLHESETKFRNVFENSPLGKSLTGVDGSLSVNKAFCDILGYSEEELKTKKWQELIHPDDIRESTDLEQLLIKGEKSTARYEIRFLHNTGNTVWTDVSTTLQRDKKDNPLFFITTINDITGRKKTEEQLKSTLHNLERSNQELEQFAYVASHDLQEPLRMVSSYTQLLERRYKDKLDQDANEFIQFAVDGANRMQKLINDLLDYSRISSRGKEFTIVDISQVLGQVISNLHELIIENTALITNDDLPEIIADESQILRVFQNLIENAIKFKNKSELPKIHISCKKKFDFYEFSIRDNGIGMDMQYHDRIFIIFQRLHSKEEYPGTGIGLSICKRIIERHGGKIWFESKVNEGSTFYFTLSSLNK